MHGRQWYLLGAGAFGVVTLTILLSAVTPAASAQTPTILPAPTITGIPEVTATPPANTATATVAGATLTATTTTTTLLPDLTVNMFASPDPAVSGANLTYTMNVFNLGDAVAGGSTVTGSVPAGTTLDFMGPNCVARSGDVVACTVTSLPQAGSQTFTYTVRVQLSGGTLSVTAVADADNAITERDENNNRQTIFTNVVAPSVATPTVTLAPAQPTPLPPAPTEVVVPPTPAPTPEPAPAPQPAPARLWLQVVGETQTYATDDSPAWVASPGEWYYVVDQSGGWALAAWEGDPPENAIWIELNENVLVVAQ